MTEKSEKEQQAVSSEETLTPSLPNGLTEQLEELSERGRRIEVLEETITDIKVWMTHEGTKRRELGQIVDRIHVKLDKLIEKYENRFPPTTNCPHCGHMIGQREIERGSCGICGKRL